MRCGMIGPGHPGYLPAEKVPSRIAELSQWSWSVLNHIVHHRAQLGVYLRLQGVAVPAIYNDSADEKGGVFR